MIPWFRSSLGNKFAVVTGAAVYGIAATDATILSAVMAFKARVQERENVLLRGARECCIAILKVQGRRGDDNVTLSVNTPEFIKVVSRFGAAIDTEFTAGMAAADNRMPIKADIEKLVSSNELQWIDKVTA